MTASVTDVLLSAGMVTPLCVWISTVMAGLIVTPTVAVMGCWVMVSLGTLIPKFASEVSEIVVAEV